MSIIYEGIGANIMMLWILFLMTPVFFVFASVLAHSMEYAF